MKTQALFAALVFGLGAGAASANDLYVNAGVLTSDTMNPYAHLFTHDAGMFTDTIDFTVPNGSLGSVANALNVTMGALKVYDIANLSYSVWGGTAAASTAWYGTFPGNNVRYDVGLTIPGAYHILVTGSADGVAGGAYGVALVSGVPEPETYGMMLGGLALLGVIARRKSAKKV